MNAGFRIWLGIFFLIVIILLSVVNGASLDDRSQDGTTLQSLLRQKRQTRTCDCRYASDSPVCASNGVTYPSMCRFNCAKERVRRLRVVSNGTCRGKTLSDYRRTQTTRPPRPQSNSNRNSWSWSW